jgi:hypothetical protein
MLAAVLEDHPDAGTGTQRDLVPQDNVLSGTRRKCCAMVASRSALNAASLFAECL